RCSGSRPPAESPALLEKDQAQRISAATADDAEALPSILAHIARGTSRGESGKHDLRAICLRLSASRTRDPQRLQRPEQEGCRRRSCWKNPKNLGTQRTRFCEPSRGDPIQAPRGPTSTHCRWIHRLEPALQPSGFFKAHQNRVKRTRSQPYR